MDNIETLDILIVFVKGYKNNIIESIIDGKLYNIYSCRYLLGQILRQFYIPSERWFISKKVKNLWDKLTKEKIENHHYNDKIICCNEEPIEVKIYKGAELKFEKRILHKGDKFKFNSIFHEEHIIPVYSIINELCNLNSLNYANVTKVLEKMAMCRMLKEEDKKLNLNHFKFKRPNSVEKILIEVYSKVGIEICES